MKIRRENILGNVLLGTGLYLLDTVRDRLTDNLQNVRERARDTYDTAADRVSRASDVIRGEDHPGLSTAAAILIGVGIGVGVGILLAPASGEETRGNLADKVHQFSGRVKNPQGATGTYGE
jgi:YtxH-like protein